MRSIYLAGGKTKNTAVNILKQHLEDKGHRVTRDPKDPDGWDCTLRWGVSYHGNKPALNANVNQFNKREALVQFHIHEISAPLVIRNWTGVLQRDLPVLSRKCHHIKGKDIIVCHSRIEAKENEQDFFTPWIPTETEFRVWVFQDKILGVYEKVYKGEGEYTGYMRNMRFGFKFDKRDELRNALEIAQPCIKAVAALGMDFGGVDLIKGKDGKYYVLEINSMPAIETVKRSSGIRLAAAVSKWAEEL